MVRNEQVAVLLPVFAGSVALFCTILIHSLAMAASVNLFRRENKLGRVGSGPLIDLWIFALTISFAFLAHLIEIATWAALFLFCGEFKSPELAYYHSAVNYSTLGYGDLIMTPAWKLLGPLEAVDGALMFGVSTAMIFTIAQRLIRAKFEDL
jgi:Ion channel